MIWAKWMLAPRLGLDGLLATPFGPTYVAARFLTLSSVLSAPTTVAAVLAAPGSLSCRGTPNGSGVKPWRIHHRTACFEGTGAPVRPLINTMDAVPAGALDQVGEEVPDVDRNSPGARGFGSARSHTC
jgi:hypothetical protein